MTLSVRFLFAVLTAALSSVSALAAEIGKPDLLEARAGRPSFVDKTKRYTAWKVATLLEDPKFGAILDRHLSTGNHRADLNPLLRDYGIVSAQALDDSNALRTLDQGLREYKGTAAHSQNLMELRLYIPKNYIGRVDWKNLMVAYVPAGRPKSWKHIEAFDRAGISRLLDPKKPPSQPLLVSGINRREDQRAGIELVNEHLKRVGMQSMAAVAAPAMASAGSIDTTKLVRVSLKTDEEPWILGAAEIYAIVSGVQPDQAKATLTIVDMPYLDYDETTYSPNQIMIIWGGYRYAAANIQLYEHDDNTSYQQLAITLSQGVTTILGAFAPTYAVISQVATAIIQAMPSSWFTNDEDYVDTYYNIEKGRGYVNYGGAANNAIVTLSPYQLREQ